MKTHHFVYLIGWLLGIGIGIGMSQPMFAQPPQTSIPVIRELYVPVEDLDAVLAASVQRIFLSRQEFADLKAAAEETVETKRPYTSALLTANYTADLIDNRALMRGELQLDVLSEGLHAIPLQFKGVGIRSVTLDDQPAKIGKDVNGDTVLFVEGIGTHQLIAEMVLPVSVDAAQQMIRFQVPIASASKVAFTVPGNVEIKSGASIIERVVDDAQNVTRFVIVPDAGELSITMSLNNKKRSEQSTVIARGTMVTEIANSIERLHVTMEMQIVNGTTEELQFRFDEDLEIEQVQCEWMNRWEIQAINGENLLIIQLRSPTTDRVTLNVRLNRKLTAGTEWAFPSFAPKGVVGYSAIVGLVAESRLKVADIQVRSMYSVDSDLIKTATGGELLGRQAGDPALHTIAAYYCPSIDYSWSAQITKPDARLLVNSNTLFSGSNRGLEVSGGISVTPENEDLHSFDFQVPTGWNLLWVRDGNEVELRFERVQEDVGTRIRVFLAGGWQRNTTQTVWFKAEHTPPEWLVDWESMSVQLPSFPVLNATTQSGVIAVSTHDDLAAVPASTENLVVISESEKAKHRLSEFDTSFAFRYDALDWKLNAQFSRIKPRIAARVMNFLRLEPESLSVHGELVFLVAEANANLFHFSLPESTPSEVAIRAMDGVQIKQTFSSVTQGRRHWTVELADRKMGSVRLAVDFTQRFIAQQPGGEALPIVRAENVPFQTGAIAIEGHPEIDAVVRESPRRVDIGELSDADYSVGKRLIGVYGYVASNDRTVIELSRRTIKSLPSTIVQRAEVVAQISAQGRCQSAARFLLRTKSTLIECRLPENSNLWSVILDGKPASPQRNAGRLLLPVPADSQNPIRDLQIVYETEIETMGYEGQIDIAAPLLFERDDPDSAEISVPVAELKWQLNLPHGFQATHLDGRVLATTQPMVTLTGLADLFWRLGGGQTRSVLTGGTNMSYNIDAERAFEVQSTVDDLFEYDAYMDASEPVARAGRYRNDMAAGGMEMGAEGMDFSMIEVDKYMMPPTAAPAIAELAARRPAAVADRLKLAAEMKGMASGKATIVDQLAVDQFAKARKIQPWALEGVRSLVIDLTPVAGGQSIELVALGNQHAMQLGVLDARRNHSLATAIALMIVLLGLTRTTWPKRLQFLFFCVVTSLALPAVTGWQVVLQPTQFSVMVACLLLTVFYLTRDLCHSLFIRWNRSLDRSRGRDPLVQGTMLAWVLLCGTGAESPALAQQPNPFSPAVQTVADSEQLLSLLNSMQQERTARLPAALIPDDAVVIPYDSNVSAGITTTANSDRLLVPLALYERLWRSANRQQDSPATSAPAPYAFSNFAYSTTLDTGGEFRMRGTLNLEQFVEADLMIPLPLEGAVIVSAMLDESPAQLVSIAANQEPNQAAEPVPNDAGLLMLHSVGKGRKTLRFELQLKMEKSGGWRIVDCRIPSAAACALTLSVAQANTEIRFSHIADRENHVTTQPNEVIETALSIDGALSIRWRDKISEAEIDQGLSVNSLSIYDVREDVERLMWKADLEFRRSRRESFSLLVPAGYVIEKVIGDNVRSWATSIKQQEQLLDVQLLKQALGRETLTVVLSRSTVINQGEEMKLTVPAIVVPDAMLQQGKITIRNSASLELKSDELSGLTRVDVPDIGTWSQNLEHPGPLPMKAFQAYRFSQVGYQLSITAAPLTVQTSVEVQSLIKLSERETKYEAKILISANQRPLYHLEIACPAELVLEPPQVATAAQWAIRNDQVGRQILELHFADGLSGQFSVLVRGSLNTVVGDVDPVTTVAVAIPRIEVLNSGQQTGAIVVQADPQYDVRPTNLRQCDVALLNSVDGWLSAAQRQLARSVIRYRSPDFDGQFIVTQRSAVVSSFSITNVKVTDRAVEETIYIESAIASAGISEYQFLLPSSYQSARIEAPLVRQKTITPVDPSADAPLRVQLTLQDSIMGKFAIIVRKDRLLTTGMQSAPIPIIETGLTESRIVTLENASRDEVVADQLVSMETLERSELGNDAALKFLGGSSSVIYRVREDLATNETPSLTFDTKTRTVLETSGARIGLAQLILIVDQSGAYRGQQEYRVENRTEPFLEIQLPEDARLWTVQVAGENVKPSNGSNGAVRIPLIKTAEGDLDYQVILKYGGQLTSIGGLDNVRFPLMKTININVQLSQVRLWLPEELNWFGFSGTMGRAQTESELQAGWLSFRTRQIDELTQLLGSKGGVYSKIRAQHNLKQLQSSLQMESSYFQQDVGSEVNETLQLQLGNHSAAVEQARKQVVAFENQSGLAEQVVDNRIALGELYGSQRNYRSLNVASSLESNFSPDATLAQQPSQPASGPSLNQPAKQKGQQNAESSVNELSVQQQISGDYQAQASRYGRKLQKAWEENPQDSKGDVDRMMDFEHQMAGQSLDGKPSSDHLWNQTQPPVSARGLTRTAIPPQDSKRASGVLESAEQQSEQQGLLRDGALRSGFTGGGIVLNTTDLSTNRSTVSANDVFLTSLEVDFAVRGREYLFTTPGGELELAARSLSVDTHARLFFVLVIVLVVGLGYAIYRRLVPRLHSAHSTRVVVAVASCLVGTISLATGILPVYGLLAILCTVTLYATSTHPTST